MRLETLRNCAVAACLVVLTVTTYQHLGNTSRRAAEARRSGPMSGPSADVGDRICIPGIDLTKAASNLVLAVEESCPASVRSARLLEAFVRRARRRHIPVYVVAGPARRLADAAAVNYPPGLPKPLAIKPTDLGIGRIPTVALLDSAGVVRRLQIGSAPEGEEDRTVDEFFSDGGNATEPLRSVTIEEVQAMRKRRESFQLVDPRAPEERPDVTPLSGALRIPAQDLGIRGPYELSGSSLIVVDCRIIGGFACQAALLRLRSSGFTRAAGLALTRMGESPLCGS